MGEGAIERAYYSYRARAAGEHDIDDITCADLSLDSVFERIDRSASGPGGAVLYAWARTQLPGRAALSARLGPARWFAAHPAERAAFRAVFARLGRQKRGDVACELWGTPGTDYLRFKPLFDAWSIASAVAIAVSLALGFSSVFVIIGAALVNLVAFTRTNPYIGAHADSIRYLGRMMAALRSASRVIPSGTGVPELDSLPRLAAAARRVPIRGSLFGTSGSGVSIAGMSGDLVGMVLDYYRIFLLGELRAYFSFYSAFVRNRDDIAAVYETLGALDAGAAIAELLAEGGEARAASVGEDLEGIVVSGMAHPLVDGCVPVSFRAERGLIITGTNMSGKTTFLRSLGLSMAFAGTLGFAFAESFEAHPYRVVSSVEIGDDLIAGKSRYLAEAERLLFIIKACASGRVLALVDEILSGTNSADRIAASIDILGHLAGSGSLVVAATHDLEIAEATVGRYDAFHFSERLDSGDFSFDYELKPGIVDRRNALLILKRLGFGEFVRG